MLRNLRKKGKPLVYVTVFFFVLTLVASMVVSMIGIPVQ